MTFCTHENKSSILYKAVKLCSHLTSIYVENKNNIYKYIFYDCTVYTWDEITRFRSRQCFKNAAGPFKRLESDDSPTNQSLAMRFTSDANCEKQNGAFDATPPPLHHNVLQEGVQHSGLTRCALNTPWAGQSFSKRAFL